MAGGCPLSPCPKLGAAVAFAVALIAMVPTLQGPDIKLGPMQRTNLQTDNTGPLDTASYSRRTLEFPCNGETCEAWLYMPKGVGGAKPPVVIMGHGMGGQKDFGLHKFAADFAEAGLAAFVFDYRGWGGSGGSPRHWLSARRHMDDWREAIRHVRASLSSTVDTAKFALWGTSFAGGHVLVVASDPEFKDHVAAVVTQVPNLDAAVSTKTSIKQRGILKSLRMLLAGLTDMGRTAVGLPAIYLPLAGLHGSMAFMQMTADELERYHKNHPKVMQGGWQNMARAAYAAEHALYKTSPIKHVSGIAAPVLFCGANFDQLCPMDVIKRAVGLTPNAELYAADCDHFELFTPKHLPGLQHKQREFLVQKLGSPKQQQGKAGHLEQLVTQQQDAEEAAM